MTYMFDSGAEHLANTETTNNQFYSAIAGLSNGGYVVTWQDGSHVGADTTDSIKAQIFDASGAPLGGEFLVNTTTANHQYSPAVAGLNNGNFVITWRDDSGDNTIKAQAFDPSGAKIGSEFVVNTNTYSMQQHPSVSALQDGGYVISWTDSSQTLGDSSGTSIKLQRFDASGHQIGTETLVNTHTINSQSEPQVAGLSNGGYAITWLDETGAAGDMNGIDVKAQVFDSSGARSGGELLVNNVTSGRQSETDIAALSNGNFVVTWTDFSKLGGDSYGTSVKGQLFDTSGTKIGDEFLANTATNGDQFEPTVASLDDGGFVIAWYDNGGTASGETTRVLAQVFDASGTKSGSEFHVNITDPQHTGYTEPALSALSNSGFAASWQRHGDVPGDGSFNVVTRMFTPHFSTTPSDGQDSLSGSAGPDTIDGLGGGDIVTGAAGDDQLTGGAGDDTLDGGDGNDMLMGGDGRDVLKAGPGSDLLYGGAGNDAYYLGNVGGQVIELAGEGNDTVYATISVTLATDVENLVLLGSTALTGTGNALANSLIGNDGANSLWGGEGNDTLDGGLGADRLEGEAGNDTLYGGARWDTLVGGDGDDVLNGELDNDQMYGGIGNDLYYVDNVGDRTFENLGEGNDTVIASINWALAADVENLTLTGAATTGTGNGLANLITGNELANTLSGGASADTIDGGLGADSLDGGIGNDLLLGGARWDTLVGGDGNDTLDGGLDNDQMYGGLGNDVYYIDNTSDRANEDASTNEGFDTVFSTVSWNMSANVETVIFTGSANASSTGNSLSNTMTGNSGNNTFVGGVGADTISGFDGNDSIDGGLDSDLLDGGNGNDTLLGGQRWDTLVGGAGDDVLDGGTENDRMVGGTGNDTYYVDNVGDRVIENANEGIDTVYSTIDFALSADVENLILQGTAVTGTGNGLNNRITGNSQANTLSGGNGNDTLTGGLGNDLLTGGTGRDDFVFSSPASNGTDHITDFVHLTDRLVFTGSDYGIAPGHALTTAEFTVGTSAIGTGAQFLWDPTSHHLYFDADGTGAGTAIDLALIDNGAMLAKEDLFFA